MYFLGCWAARSTTCSLRSSCFAPWDLLPGNEWHEGGNHGVEMLAPRGGIEFIAASDAPSVDAMVEVSDADAAYEIVKKLISEPHSPDPLCLNPPCRQRQATRMGHPQRRRLGRPRAKIWDTAVKIRREIGDTPYGARLFEVEVGGLRLGFLTYAKKA